MSSPVVKCVPDFSAARQPVGVDQFREATAALPGAFVLDLHSALDHKHSVLTYAGSPAGVAEAALQATARTAAAGVQEVETSAV